MTGAGIRREDIARCLGTRGIDLKTMRKHFSHELAVGVTKVNGLCAQGLVKLMQEGNLGALCFWAKTRMGWRETVKAVFTGENDGPIEFRNTDTAKRALEDRIAGVAERIRSGETVQ
jgi:hypothetical protein